MGGIFNLDGPLMQFLNKMADIMILSLLWLVCSLPVITIGASTTALYYASMKSIRDEGSTVKNFFKSFRENWKQAVLAELILLLITYILYIDLQVIFSLQGSAAGILQILFLVVVFVYVSLASYLFPLLARFIYSTKTLFKNAFLISVMNLPGTVVIVLVNALPVLLFVLRPDLFFRLLPLLLFMGTGLIAYLNSLLFIRIFRKYTPREYLEQEAEV